MVTRPFENLTHQSLGDVEASTATYSQCICIHMYCNTANTSIYIIYNEISRNLVQARFDFLTWLPPKHPSNMVWNTYTSINIIYNEISRNLVLTRFDFLTWLPPKQPSNMVWNTNTSLLSHLVMERPVQQAWGTAQCTISRGRRRPNVGPTSPNRPDVDRGNSRALA